MNIFNFIIENKEWLKPLCYLLVSVISTILVIVLKKKKVLNEMDLILVDVLKQLPGFINLAEALGEVSELNKQRKLEIVLSAVRKYVADKFSVILPDSVMTNIQVQIEAILSTPQKK